MGFFRFLAGILLVVLTIGFAGAIFQAGFSAGAAGAAGAAGGAVAYPWYGWGWGWGFGGFSILGTLFTLFIVFALIRFAFGGRRHGHAGPCGERGWGRHGWGPGGPDDRMRFSGWEGRAREVHDEWHRRTDGSGQGGAAQGAAPDASPAAGSTFSNSSGTSPDERA